MIRPATTSRPVSGGSRVQRMIQKRNMQNTKHDRNSRFDHFTYYQSLDRSVHTPLFSNETESEPLLRDSRSGPRVSMPTELPTINDNESTYSDDTRFSDSGMVDDDSSPVNASPVESSPEVERCKLSLLLFI